MYQSADTYSCMKLLEKYTTKSALQYDTWYQQLYILKKKNLGNEQRQVCSKYTHSHTMYEFIHLDRLTQTNCTLFKWLMLITGPVSYPFLPSLLNIFSSCQFSYLLHISLLFFPTSEIFFPQVVKIAAVLTGPRSPKVMDLEH